MGESTAIAWATSTFNPWIGCTKVSPGCDHCYAETLDKRHKWGGAVHWGPGVPRRRTSEANWRLPLRWNAKAAVSGEPWRVFCASLADVFDNEVPSEWRRDLFKLIAETPNLTWMLLTKRIGNVASMVPPEWLAACSFEWPPNVWLGITVVTQEEADRDIPKLLDLNPCIAWLSIEPQLGPVRLGYYIRRPRFAGDKRIDWVITGGESGHGARPYDPEWALSLIGEGHVTGTPVFLKQMGSNFGFKDRAGADPTEWPEDYRVQQFPQ